MAKRLIDVESEKYSELPLDATGLSQPSLKPHLD